MAKREAIFTYIGPSLKSLYEDWAKAADCTLSAYVKQVLLDHALAQDLTDEEHQTLLTEGPQRAYRYRQRRREAAPAEESETPAARHLTLKLEAAVSATSPSQVIAALKAEGLPPRLSDILVGDQDRAEVVLDRLASGAH